MPREIVLDTETTGFEPHLGHRLVEALHVHAHDARGLRGARNGEEHDGEQAGDEAGHRRSIRSRCRRSIKAGLRPAGRMRTYAAAKRDDVAPTDAQHPACADGQADNAETCLALIRDEPLVTPQAVAEESLDDILF